MLGLAIGLLICALITFYMNFRGSSSDAQWACLLSLFVIFGSVGYIIDYFI